VLDIGAGNGRATLDLTGGGAAVVALDADASLLDALEQRAAGLPVETVVADRVTSPSTGGSRSCSCRCRRCSCC
jgi:16S rRNA A1518/A1519 N6-dimethyltransferase RsmA/KsgA/DIM1 with predicted DNA glycosylase/AP lyase activity